MSIKLIKETVAKLPEYIGKYSMDCPSKAQGLIECAVKISKFYDEHRVSFVCASGLEDWGLSEANEFIQAALELEGMINDFFKLALSREDKQ